MIEIDRMALLIKPKQSFLDWINQVNEESMSLSELILDCTVLLVPMIEDEADFNQYLQGTYQTLFEQELLSWCTDADLWPKKMDFDTFNMFFDIEVHGLVLDNVVGDYEELEEVTLQ
jgi:hypothetical protein